MRIRMAKPCDLATVAACKEFAFGLAAGNIPGKDVSFGRMLARQVRDGEIHLICDVAHILGYISFAPSFDHLFVDTIVILPGHQRKGLGSQLLDFAEEVAIEHDIYRINLFADGRGTGNAAFYDHNGYRETSRCEERGFSRVFYSKKIVRPSI